MVNLRLQITHEKLLQRSLDHTKQTQHLHKHLTLSRSVVTNVKTYPRASFVWDPIRNLQFDPYIMYTLTDDNSARKFVQSRPQSMADSGPRKSKRHGERLGVEFG